MLVWPVAVGVAHDRCCVPCCPSRSGAVVAPWQVHVDSCPEGCVSTLGHRDLGI